MREVQSAMDRISALAGRSGAQSEESAAGLTEGEPSVQGERNVLGFHGGPRVEVFNPRLVLHGGCFNPKFRLHMLGSIVFRNDGLQLQGPMSGHLITPASF